MVLPKQGATAAALPLPARAAAASRWADVSGNGRVSPLRPADREHAAP